MENPLLMAIFNSYVKLPEGTSCSATRNEAEELFSLLDADASGEAA